MAESSSVQQTGQSEARKRGPFSEVRAIVEEGIALLSSDVYRLQKQNSNLAKLYMLEEWSSLDEQHIQAWRTAQDVRNDTKRLLQIRALIQEADIEEFEKTVCDIKTRAVRSLAEFLKLQRKVTSGHTEPTPTEACSLPAVDLQSSRRVRSVSDTAVPQQPESMPDIPSTGTSSRRTRPNSEGGYLHSLCDYVENSPTAMRYALPAVGGILGTMAAGPFGMLAGFKIGAAAAVSGGVAGMAGGKLLQSQNDSAQESDGDAPMCARQTEEPENSASTDDSDAEQAVITSDEESAPSDLTEEEPIRETPDMNIPAAPETFTDSPAVKHGSSSTTAIPPQKSESREITDCAAVVTEPKQATSGDDSCRAGETCENSCRPEETCENSCRAEETCSKAFSTWNNAEDTGSSADKVGNQLDSSPVVTTSEQHSLGASCLSEPLSLDLPPSMLTQVPTEHDCSHSIQNDKATGSGCLNDAETITAPASGPKPLVLPCEISNTTSSQESQGSSNSQSQHEFESQNVAETDSPKSQANSVTETEESQEFSMAGYSITSGALKAAALPLMGGLVGTALAGPIGMLAGAKLATLGALTGGALGATTGKLLQENNEPEEADQGEDMESFNAHVAQGEVPLNIKEATVPNEPIEEPIPNSRRQEVITRERKEAQAAVQTETEVPVTGQEAEATVVGGKQEGTVTGEEQKATVTSELTGATLTGAEGEALGSAEEVKVAMNDKQALPQEMTHVISEDEGDSYRNDDNEEEPDIVRNMKSLWAKVDTKKLRMVAVPVLGGIVGTALAGPVGLVAGVKLGTAGAVGGGVLGMKLGEVVEEHISASFPDGPMPQQSAGQEDHMPESSDSGISKEVMPEAKEPQLDAPCSSQTDDTFKGHISTQSDVISEGGRPQDFQGSNTTEGDFGQLQTDPHPGAESD